MDPITLPPGAPDTVLFRPSKKRKIYRQRANDDVPNTTSPPPGLSLDRDHTGAAPVPGRPSSADTDLEGTQVPMSEILRLRKLRRQRVGGVEFRATATAGRGEEGQDGALVLHEHGKTEEDKEEAQIGGGVVRRFARQTGMVGDVDKHMMAYIDSELAKRRLTTKQPPASPSTNDSPPQDHTASSDPTAVQSTKPSQTVERQPAALGKLLEIDLGNEARDRNVVRTEQARRRLDGEVIEEEPAGGRKPKKVRLGRDGKPWRERKRRTSDDIRRDKLVEEVLRENRLDMYEPPPATLTTTADDGEADDQIAEAFRREFMDAVSARQRKKPAATSSSSAAGGRGAVSKKEEEMLRGPKLGGSRSARAAMREAQLKELRAGKK